MSTDDYTPTPPTPCPVCGYVLSAASPAPSEPDQSSTPLPGDITVCMRCAEPLIFDAVLRARLITDLEWRALPRHVCRSIQQLRDAIKAARIVHGGGNA